MLAQLWLGPQALGLLWSWSGDALHYPGSSCFPHALMEIHLQRQMGCLVVSKTNEKGTI